MVETKKTYCRFCHAYCPMEATVEDNKLIAIGPDTSNKLYGGYTCIKGRQLVEQTYHPSRLQQSQKKQPNGNFAPIGSEQAMDEVAEQLQNILKKYGPRSIASYNGTYSFQNSAANPVARAWHNAIGSPSYYTSVTIDQPAKAAIGPARMGWWNGGSHMWNDSHVALIIGNNTLVSHFSMPGGIPSFSPANALREGKKRGMKIICVDPRKSEVASRSDLHLQIRPGLDAALIASILQVIIAEELHDSDFCAEHTRGLEDLTTSIQAFTPARVAAAADIPVEQIYSAARMFAAGPKGSAVCGTGPEMAPHPNLLQHLVQSLNAICGRHYREGESVPNPGVLSLDIPRQAQASPPQPEWLNDGLKSRISQDIGEIVIPSPYGPVKEMPTTVISDEMLLPGEGQIKALICVGGNPLLAWPNQEKTHRALAGLELLVCVDIQMAATAQMADYVLAAKICLEREDVTLLTDTWYDQPYSQYTQTVVAAEGDQIEEWELYWGLGKRMGLAMSMDNGPIDMENKPSKLELLKNITGGSRVPVEQIAAREGGTVFQLEDVILGPADPETRASLDLYPEGLKDELAAARSDLEAAIMKDNSADFSHLLISRRMKNSYNSTGPELSQLKIKGTTNPAYIHSEDLARLGIADGELIQIFSAHGQIPAVATASDDVKPGVISMSHCWGGSPEPTANSDAKVREIGSNTNRLVDNLEQSAKYSGMCRQSNIPVGIRRSS